MLIYVYIQHLSFKISIYMYSALILLTIEAKIFTICCTKWCIVLT